LISHPNWDAMFKDYLFWTQINTPIKGDGQSIRHQQYFSLESDSGFFDGDIAYKRRG